MRLTNRSGLFALIGLGILWFTDSPATADSVARLKVTTLSTMLTEFSGVGEWGYAALVETEHGTVLFDTGARPGTVLQNARELGLDLSQAETAVLSHHHWDHTGGLVRLRSELREIVPGALATTHVGEGIFVPRRLDREAAAKLLTRIPTELLVSAGEVKEGYEALGGSFLVHDGPAEILPGVWVTGPIPRVHPERNWTPFEMIEIEGSWQEDTIVEDQALVVDTSEGLVVVVGCGHAGLVNTLEYAREMLPGKPVHAVMGGFHLLNLDEEAVAWTGEKLAEFGVANFIGAHCTGINAVTGVRAAAGLDRSHAVVGAVGTTFTLEGGIRPGALNR